MQNIFLQGVLCVIPVNVICNMTSFRKDKIPFDPIQGFKDVTCKGNIVASMLLYDSFPLT